MKLYAFAVLKEVFEVYKKYFLPFFLASCMVVGLQWSAGYVPRFLAKKLGVYQEIALQVNPTPLDNPRAQQTPVAATKKALHWSIHSLIEKVTQYAKKVPTYKLIFISIITFLLYMLLVVASLAMLQIGLSAIRGTKVTFKTCIPYTFLWLFLKTTIIFFIAILISSILLAVLFGFLLMDPVRLFFDTYIHKLVYEGLISIVVLSSSVFLIYYILRHSFYSLYILDNKARTAYAALRQSYGATDGKMLQILKVYFFMWIIMAFVFVALLFVAQEYKTATKIVFDLFTKPLMVLVYVVIYEKINNK